MCSFGVLEVSVWSVGVIGDSMCSVGEVWGQCVDSWYGVSVWTDGVVGSSVRIVGVM